MVVPLRCYRQTYTDYEKVYSFTKTTEGRESKTEVAESDAIRDVEHLVRYAAGEPDPEPEASDMEDYVRMLYAEILGNESPTEFQVSTWVGNIKGVMRVVDVVDQFTQSAAFTAKGYTDEQKVRVFYAGMLGNESPTDYQVSYWTGRLASGTALLQVVDGFGQSAAFGVVRGLYGLRA